MSWTRPMNGRPRLFGQARTLCQYEYEKHIIPQPEEEQTRKGRDCSPFGPGRRRIPGGIRLRYLTSCTSCQPTKTNSNTTTACGKAIAIGISRDLTGVEDITLKLEVSRNDRSNAAISRFGLQGKVYR